MNERVSVEANHKKKLKEVIRRLEIISHPIAIFTEISPEKIFSRISDLEKLDETKITLDKQLLFSRLCKNQKYNDDQYHLLAHLFLAVRKDIPSNEFNKDQEKQNINVVSSLLVGNTHEAGTGKGKSGVVSPVLLFFRSVWPDKKNEPIILSVPNTNLLNEAVGIYDNLRNRMVEGLKGDIRDKVESKSRYTVDKQKINPEKLDFINDLTKPIDDGLTESYLKKIRVVFQTHNQTFFSLIEKANIQGNANVPLIIFDEMHQLVGEKFISSSKKNVRKPEVKPESFLNTPLGEDISAFVLSKFLYRELSKDEGNFLYQGNALALSEQGFKKTVGYKNIIKMKIRHDKQLRAIIEQFVLPSLKFKTKKKEEIIKSILSNLKNSWDNLASNDALGDGDLVDYKKEFLIGLANNITDVMGGVKPGKGYIVKDSKVVVRESGRGITLPSHEYKSDTNFFIRVVDDNLHYEYRPGNDRLRYCYSSATWIAYIAKGRVQGLTANLYKQNLRTGRKTEGQLVNIINTFSEGKAVPSDEKMEKLLPIPDPVIFENQSQLIQGLKKPDSTTAKFNQRMIICYNDFFAQKIAQEMGGENIGTIISTTSNKETKKILKRFANGELKTIISSGRAGYGVNLKKKDGSLPNFHITIINPERQIDVKQGFGRLRAEKKLENFSIFLTEEFLNQISTTFYDSKPLPLPHYHTTDEFKQAILDYKDGKDKDKFKDLFFEILAKNDEKYLGDFVYEAKLELSFWQKIAPVVVEIKKGIYQKLASDKNTYFSKLLDKAVVKIPKHEKEFVRAQLANDLIDYLSFPEESLLENFFKEAALMELQPAVYGNDQSAIINNLIGTWYEGLVGKEDVYRQYYTDLLQNSEYLKREIPQTFIQAKVKFYEYLTPLLQNQIPFESIDLNKVESISIETLPLLKESYSSKKLINNVDPQKFVKIGKDKYLIVIPNKNSHKQAIYLWSGALPEKGSRISALTIDISEVSKVDLEKLKESIPKNIFWIFPIVGQTDKVVTKAVMIKYKE